ncbi:MAG TPA: hypothetical protein VGD65_12980 [Chryseosolibacter sp.]
MISTHHKFDYSVKYLSDAKFSFHVGEAISNLVKDYEWSPLESLTITFHEQYMMSGATKLKEDVIKFTDDLTSASVDLYFMVYTNNKKKTVGPSETDGFERLRNSIPKVYEQLLERLKSAKKTPKLDEGESASEPPKS